MDSCEARRDDNIERGEVKAHHGLATTYSVVTVEVPIVGMVMERWRVGDGLEEVEGPSPR